jgi:hypothetical protein
MITLFVCESNFPEQYPEVFHFAVCAECKMSWRVDSNLDRAMEVIATHRCAHKILAGPIHVEVSSKAMARVVRGGGA